MRTCLPVLLPALLVLSAASGARAGEAGAVMEARIELVNNCRVTARDLDFGVRDTLASTIDASTTLDVACTNRGPFTVRFDRGTGAGASFAARRLSNGVDTVDYSLYADASRSRVLGDAAEGSVQLTGTGAGDTQTFTVFGRVFAGQGPKSPGVYTDTVTATLGY